MVAYLLSSLHTSLCRTSEVLIIYIYVCFYQIMLGELREPAVKKTKGQPYFTPELAYILASCEERIPLVNLGLEVKDFYQLHVCDHQPQNYLIYLIKRTVFVTIKKKPLDSIIYISRKCSSL